MTKERSGHMPFSVSQTVCRGTLVCRWRGCSV